MADLLRLLQLSWEGELTARDNSFEWVLDIGHIAIFPPDPTSGWRKHYMPPDPLD